MNGAQSQENQTGKTEFSGCTRNSDQSLKRIEIQTKLEIKFAHCAAREFLSKPRSNTEQTKGQQTKSNAVIEEPTPPTAAEPRFRPPSTRCTFVRYPCAPRTKHPKKNL